MSHRLKCAGLLVAQLVLAASPCAASDMLKPPVVELRTAPVLVERGKGPSIRVERAKVAMIVGDEIGYRSMGAFCGSREKVLFSQRGLAVFPEGVRQTTTMELRKLGYRLEGIGQAGAFDVDVNAAPDFRLGVVVNEMNSELCYAIGTTKAEGWVLLKLTWALFSERQQKVVFQRATEGLGTSTDKILDLHERAIRASLHNFLAAPEFSEALAASLVGPNTSPSAMPASAPVAQGGEAILLKAPPSLDGGVQKNQSRMVNAVVKIETGIGFGSGFFIDKAGHLLTNAHVVEGAKYARLTLKNGDKVVAEVIKVNAMGDVALLKAANPAEDTLSVSTSGSPDVGSDVYAIGSPSGLNHTLTKGVLSANRTIQGYRFLQSDAAITFGSSGGPLLDADGRVIGIAVRALNGGVNGLNFFIPIGEALKDLNVNLLP